MPENTQHDPARPSGPAPAGNSAQLWPWVSAITALGLGFRLFRLNAYPLWTDEIFSFNLARLPLRGILAYHDQTPPLFALFLHFWIALGGSDPFWLRLPSVLAGTAVIPLTYVIAKRVGSPAAALLATLLCALSVDLVMVSQEVRAYAFFVLLATASLLCLMRLSENWTRGRALSYWICTTLMLYTHVFGVFFVAAQAVWYLSFGRRLIPVRKGLLLQLLVGAAWLPWLPILLGASQHVAGGFWIPRPTVFEVVLTARQVLGFRPLAYATAVLFVLAAWQLRKNRAPRELLVWCLALLPAAIPFVASFWIPIYWPPYVIPIAVTAFVLVGIGLDFFQNPRRRRAFGLAVGLLAVVPIVMFYVSGQAPDARQDWIGTFAALDAMAAPNATVVMNTGMCADHPLPSCPYPLYGHRTDLHFVPYFLEDRGRADKINATNVKGLAPLVVGSPEVWVLYTYDRDPGRFILHELALEGWHSAGELHFKRVQLRHFTR